MADYTAHLIMRPPKEYCGLFGVSNNDSAAKIAYLGLYALQHRGEESAGIAVWDGKQINSHKATGLVNDVFPPNVIDQLKGSLAIGHVRYSTTGSSTIKNAQPIHIVCKQGPIAIGHNGNLVNSLHLRKSLEKQGAIFQSTTDSEIIVHLISRSKHKVFEKALLESLAQIKGSYSLIILVPKKIIAVRDPQGFRPLVIGKVDNSFIVASETCALDLVNARYLRDVEAGEIVILDEKGLHSWKPEQLQSGFLSYCIFEHIYFARPDSIVFGKNVYEIREALGRTLAKNHPADADIVVPVPDSGVTAAIGYAHQSGLPFEMGMIRNHYVGRTFIQPSQQLRDLGVKIKLNPVKSVLKGKKVVVVDDSIVRGTTSQARIKTVKDAGAKEVHLRISCPPHRHPCFYGIDFAHSSELIASRNNTEQIRNFIGADTLEYLTVEELLSVEGEDKDKYCSACFTGKYPVKCKKPEGKYCLECQKI